MHPQKKKHCNTLYQSVLSVDCKLPKFQARKLHARRKSLKRSCLAAIFKYDYRHKQ